MLWFLIFSCSQNSIQKCEQSDNPHECLRTAISRTSFSEEVLGLCSQLTEASVRGECHFLVSDIHQLTGQSARQICTQATPFTEDCLRHAAGRDVEMTIFSTLTQATPQPMKLLPRIHGVVKQYLPPQIAESMSRDMMIRFQASRVTERMTSIDCTGLNPAMCSQVYIVASLGSRGQWTEYFEEPWMVHCGNALTNVEAREWGWKTWTPDMDAVVQQAYSQICNATQGRTPQMEGAKIQP